MLMVATTVHKYVLQAQVLHQILSSILIILKVGKPRRLWIHVVVNTQCRLSNGLFFHSELVKNRFDAQSLYNVAQLAASFRHRN